MHPIARIVITFLMAVSRLLYAPAPANAEDPAAALLRVQIDLANKGQAGDQYFLGEMYEKGLGTRADLDEARKWYQKAADQGFELAIQRLDELAATPETTATEQAAPKPPVVAKPAPAKPVQKTGSRKSAAEDRARAQRELERKRAEWREAMRRQATRNQDPFE